MAHISNDTHELPETVIPRADLDKMTRSAEEATEFLKAISHQGRLMLLCHLASGEKSVTELEDLLDLRQASVSQHLARLRQEGLVAPRRDGKTVFYSLSGERPTQIMAVLYDMFCKD